MRQEASEEFSDAFVWYEEQQTGLGYRFKNAIDNKINLICRNPYHYKVSYKTYHEAFTEKFPFAIIYTVDEDSKSITVMAIFHTSRNPKKKFITI
ncbi:MAG: type II toxin-antitoxin system RelE/ParE family toxin [Bacteroidota bacterium]